MSFWQAMALAILIGALALFVEWWVDARLLRRSGKVRCRDDTVNYVYCDAKGRMRLSTTGFPENEVHTKLAVVKCKGGAVASLTDEREAKP